MDNNINTLAERFHAQKLNVGWWEGTPVLTDKVMLIICDLAAATEADRTGAADDHLPLLMGAEAELADAFIRLLDLGGYLGLEYVHDAENVWIGTPPTLATKHLQLSAIVGSMGMFLDSEEGIVYSAVIDLMLLLAKEEGYCLIDAARAKLHIPATMGVTG